MQAGVAIADDATVAATLHGFIDSRLAVDDGPVNGENGGLGKTRFGGDSSGGARPLAHVQAAARLQVMIGWDWSANVSGTAGGGQSNAVDAQEAFLRYKPAPSGDLAFEAKLGVFIPPISLENTGLAWTSPYTLSPSALNAWIGDEIRGLGGEVSATQRLMVGDETFKLRTTVGIFGFDDPAGALLAWRGWAVHDGTAGIFERHPLSPLRSLMPGGSVPQQAPYVQPFHELDGRPGYYAGASLTDVGQDEVRALYYDNRADTHVFDGRQYAWHTRFGSFGVKTTLPADIDIAAQAITGRTTMNLRASPLGAVVDVHFMSAFLLASHAWDRDRVSLRLEYFKNRDLDKTPDDNNAERGKAVTAAYIFRPADDHRITFEIVHVQSNRPERIFQGLSAQQNENIAQVSWRVSL